MNVKEEISEEPLLEFAEHLYNLYEALIFKGFNDEQAMCILIKYMETMSNASSVSMQEVPDDD